jgi:ornithine--oxo-acid transaminase
MNTLARNSKSFSFVIEKAKGSWLYDTTGKKYLDAFSSFSSANFGHCHPLLHKKLIEQSKKLSVFSRTCSSDVLLTLCDILQQYYHASIQTSSLKTIPMNSGVEAGETAVKLARKWGYHKKGIAENQAKIIFAHNNYWGRTISAISTSNYDQRHFFPATPGFHNVDYNNLTSLHDMLNTHGKTIAAVFLEPIQGEGGINLPSPSYFKKVRELCDEHNVLLICDEIQTGMGRTGTPLCIESYDTKADMILLGKSLGGGFLPFSVCMARSDIADLFVPGEHSSTFGGFPLGAKMAIESLTLLHTDRTIRENVMCREKELQTLLTDLMKRFPYYIKEIRGKGMLWGIELHRDHYTAWDVVQQLTTYGLVTREANHNVVRICPPLTITTPEMSFLSDQLQKCFLQL